MDKYLVPGKKDSSVLLPSHKNKKKYKQLTIESLKGVVNIDDILRIKHLLKVPNQSEEIILKCLKTLSDKLPSRSVLTSTKIGNTVYKLTKHQDKVLASKAKDIVNSWQTFYKNKSEKPQIDVLCDHKTNSERQRSRRQLENVLNSDLDKEVISLLAESIEREVFLRFKIIQKSYILSIRKIISELEKNESLKSDVLRHVVSCKNLLDLCCVENYAR